MWCLDRWLRRAPPCSDLTALLRSCFTVATTSPATAAAIVLRSPAPPLLLLFSAAPPPLLLFFSAAPIPYTETHAQVTQSRPRSLPPYEPPDDLSVDNTPGRSYERLPLYTKDVVRKYTSRKLGQEMPPHVFNIAHDAYYGITAFKELQSIIIVSIPPSSPPTCTRKHAYAHARTQV